MKIAFVKFLGACALLFAVVASTACGLPKADAHPGLDAYRAAQSHLIGLRDSLATAYPKQGTEAKAKAIEFARKHLIRDLDKVMLPAWNGTTWDFNGTSLVPGEGKIACGYFITTVLRDAGFKLERAKMAQQASLFIIRSLTPAAERKDWSYLTPAQFETKVKTLPKGLYVLGLDIHTGFILHRADGIFFIHASYMQPAEVKREIAADSKVIGASKRFVLGRVDNEWLLDKWIRSEAIITVTQ